MSGLMQVAHELDAITVERNSFCHRVSLSVSRPRWEGWPVFRMVTAWECRRK
jgi:hypothetical protein